MAAWHECVFPCVCTLLSCAFAEPENSAVESARQGQQPEQPGVARTNIRPGDPAGRVVGGSASNPREDETPSNPYALFGENDRIDFAERTRQLIMDIAAYAKRVQPGFAVIVENGIDLMTRDGTLKTDSQTDFVKAIDGIVVEGLYGPDSTILTRQLQLAMIQRHRVDHWAVLAQDRTSSLREAESALREFRRLSFIPLISPLNVSTIAPIPDLRSRPINENALNIQSLSAVRNYLNLADAASFKSQADMIYRLAETNYDMLLLPLHHPTDRYLSRGDVRELRMKRLGAQRALIGRLALPVAEIGAYYWQREWSQRRPRWVQEEGRLPATLHVRYWTPQWREILFGTPRSLIDGMISIGLNGVLLDTTGLHNSYEQQQLQAEGQAGVRQRVIGSDRTFELLQQMKGSR